MDALGHITKDSHPEWNGFLLTLTTDASAGRLAMLNSIGQRDAEEVQGQQQQKLLHGEDRAL